MPLLRLLANTLAAGLAVAYPFAVYFGLQTMEPRELGGLLLAVLLLRHWQAVRQFAGSIALAEWAIIAGLGFLALAVTISNSETLLLLYPAAVSISLLLAFGRTLFDPPSMIERIARLSEPDLSPEGVRYTRRVTQVWCGFFVINAAMAAATVFSSKECWLLYNGLISYILIGCLFAIEWMVRLAFSRRAI